MRVPLSWLGEFVALDVGLEELAELLALKGMPVESIERPWAGLSGVVAARVLDVADHPRSDTLCVARVDHGSGEAELVVGVRNMGPGDLVPWAPPGATVPALAEPLGVREIRGVTSHGMLCSARELGISTDHSAILVLDDLEPGVDVASALGLDDVVLDLEVESNRPDQLSILGIAREVAAARRLQLRSPSLDVAEDYEGAASVATVRVDDGPGAPRYLARVIRGAGGGATPLPTQARLTAAGARPISPAVDATNYVMLELGQPLHAFDLARLAGPGIVVRRAEEGERLVTLDGIERELRSQDLLICDAERPIAIAGVMGGATSEVDASTTDVLLESAWFEPRGILRTSRRLQLLTEASIRFSRGTDPEGVPGAAGRAAALMAAWSGGRVLRGAVEVGGAPARRIARARLARARHLLGYEVTPTEAVEALGSIGIEATTDGETLAAEIPGFRPDLVSEVDVIEELVRVQGYDRLPSTRPRVPQAGGEQPTYSRRRRIRELLRAAGLREAASLSFASRADMDLMREDRGVVVANPPSAEQPFLRTSLLPNLLAAAARNADRGSRSVALFEVGHVFRLDDPVDERELVAIVMAGPVGEGLHGERREFDVLDAKGVLGVLLDGLGIGSWALGTNAGSPFHPGRSAGVEVGAAAVGVVGEVAPRIATARGIASRIAVFELDVDALEGSRTRGFRSRDIPRFPPVRRDLAFELPHETPAGDVHAAIVDAGGEFLSRVELFDVFVGPPLLPGTRSLAFAVEIRSPDRTLTDAEADAVVDRIVARVTTELGGSLRSG